MKKLKKPTHDVATIYSCYLNENVTMNTTITVGVTVAASVAAAVITLHDTGDLGTI